MIESIKNNPGRASFILFLIGFILVIIGLAVGIDILSILGGILIFLALLMFLYAISKLKQNTNTNSNYGGGLHRLRR